MDVFFLGMGGEFFDFISLVSISLNVIFRDNVVSCIIKCVRKKFKKEVSVMI